MYSIDPQTLKEFGSEGTKAGSEYSVVKPLTPGRFSQHLVTERSPWELCLGYGQTEGTASL